MIVYHGTTKENAQSILKEGFSIEKQGENGSHFGKGIYLTTTKKRAKVYGKHVVSVEIDNTKLYLLTNWLKDYKNKCQEVYEAGTSADNVNTVVGEYIKNLYTSQGYTGILMEGLIGKTKEIVIYDALTIKNIF